MTEPLGLWLTSPLNGTGGSLAQLGTSDLPPKNGQLVAQNHQFEILGSIRAESKEDEREHALRQGVDDGQNQGGPPPDGESETLSEQHQSVHGQLGQGVWILAPHTFPAYELARLAKQVLDSLQPADARSVIAMLSEDPDLAWDHRCRSVVEGALSTRKAS